MEIPFKTGHRTAYFNVVPVAFIIKLKIYLIVNEGPEACIAILVYCSMRRRELDRSS